MTTEALIFLGELDPEAIGPNLEHATHYEPTPLDQAERLLDAVPLAPDRTTFVDLGSGLGRIVLLAASRPYRQVIGVELSPALHAVAQENRARFSGQLLCRDVRLVHADAARFRMPRGDLVVYLYNPFDAVVLEPIVAQLVAGREREVVLLYHTPLERASIDARPEFACIADLGFGLVYRRRRELATQRRISGRA